MGRPAERTLSPASVLGSLTDVCPHLSPMCPADVPGSTTVASVPFLNSGIVSPFVPAADGHARVALALEFLEPIVRSPTTRAVAAFRASHACKRVPIVATGPDRQRDCVRLPNHLEQGSSNAARRHPPGQVARMVSRIGSPWLVALEGLAAAAALRASGRPAGDRVPEQDRGTSSL